MLGPCLCILCIDCDWVCSDCLWAFLSHFTSAILNFGHSWGILWYLGYSHSSNKLGVGSRTVCICVNLMYWNPHWFFGGACSLVSHSCASYFLMPCRILQILPDSRVSGFQGFLGQLCEFVLESFGFQECRECRNIICEYLWILTNFSDTVSDILNQLWSWWGFEIFGLQQVANGGLHWWSWWSFEIQMLG